MRFIIRTSPVGAAKAATAVVRPRQVAIPTDAQKEAGNYKKAHLYLHGLNISIENPRGSIRSGTDPGGHKWSVRMQHHYGYIRGHRSRDGDQVDVFVGPNPASRRVYVVNQVDPRTGRFDEHKVMMGFNTAVEARAAYLSNYEKGWRGLGNMIPMSIERFKEWLEGDTTKRARKAQEGYIGVDLDGTLAHYDGDASKIGEPVPAMLARVKRWLSQGKKVKIFTARAATPELIPAIKSWLEKHGLGHLEITNEKDPAMIELWDDRAVRVERNTGIRKARSHIRLVVLPGAAKAIIQTPRVSGSNKIDWEAVPVGASIWISVSDPSSPLHGRPILITKRPDGQAAVDPGEARRHGYNVGSWADDAFKKQGEGMAHATFQFGKLQEQKKDKERWEQYEQREKEREPHVQKLRQLRGEASSKTREMEKKFLESMGVSQFGLTSMEKQTVHESAKRQALDAGMEPELAEAYGKSVARIQEQLAKRFQRDVALRRMKYYERVVEKFKEPPEEKPGDARRGDPEDRIAAAVSAEQVEAAAQVAAAEAEPLEVEAPTVPLNATTPQEVEHHVAEDLLKRLAEARKRREEYQGIREEAKKDAIILRAVGEGEGPFDKIVRTHDREAAQAAVDAFENLQRAKAEQQEIKRIMPEKLPRPETSGPNAIEALRLRAVEAIDDEKIREAESRYRAQVEASPEKGFYAVVSEHWNDEDGYLINGGVQDGASDYLNGLLKKKRGFVSGGAAAALTGIVGKHTGLEMDVGRLSAAVSPEVAATIVGYSMVGMARQRQLKDKGIGAIVQAIEEDNRGNLLKMEDQALERDRDLKASYEEIRRQKSNGELAAEATIMRLEAENILQRRENMGRALGSLAASGTLLAAMKRAQKDVDERLSINVGSSKDNAGRILESLGVKSGRSLPPEIKITHNFLGDTIQYQITAPASFLASRWAKSQEIVSRETQELENIKNNDAPIVPTDNPPHFKKTWKNELGKEEAFLLRQSQRNDIGFLKKLGGGLITRSTGAGKTFTGLGFASHVLKEDPKAKQIIIVPDGLVDQWGDQANRATNLKMLKIPEKQTKDQRAKIWKQVQDGHVVVVSHSDALKAQSDVDAIIGANFKTAIIDEPQNLKSQTSAKLGTAARRIINVPFQHRVALTATPARESFDEIYDWVHWSTKQLREDKPFDKRGRPIWNSRIGTKVGFGRMYAGAGGGTNAQDEAIQKMIFDKLGPFVSGDRFRSRNYKVHHNEHQVVRTEAQIKKQRQIESDYDTYRAKIEADVKKKAKGKGGFYVKHRVNHLIRKEMNNRHWDNLHGGQDNGKSRQVVANVQKHIAEGRNSHIVFVDSETQRNSMSSAFKKAGIGNLYDISELHKRAKFRGEAEQIAQDQGVDMDQAVARLVAKRKTDWAAHKEKGAPAVIFIDRTSQAGHNLQKGDTLSIAGRPDDAAAQFQIIGRGDRSPREGDFHVDTYRYSDSPWEDTHWNELRNQLKIVQSITPALVKSQVAVLIKSMARSITSRGVAKYFGLEGGCA